jgi:hypothetical protein
MGRATDRKRKEALKAKKKAVSKTPDSSAASKNGELQIHHAVSSTHSEPSEKQI